MPYQLLIWNWDDRSPSKVPSGASSWIRHHGTQTHNSHPPPSISACSLAPSTLCHSSEWHIERYIEPCYIHTIHTIRRKKRWKIMDQNIPYKKSTLYFSASHLQITLQPRQCHESYKIPSSLLYKWTKVEINYLASACALNPQPGHGWCIRAGWRQSEATGRGGGWT